MLYQKLMGPILRFHMRTELFFSGRTNQANIGTVRCANLWDTIATTTPSFYRSCEKSYNRKSAIFLTPQKQFFALYACAMRARNFSIVFLDAPYDTAYSCQISSGLVKALRSCIFFYTKPPISFYSI